MKEEEERRFAATWTGTKRLVDGWEVVHVPDDLVKKALCHDDLSPPPRPPLASQAGSARMASQLSAALGGEDGGLPQGPALGGRKGYAPPGQEVRVERQPITGFSSIELRHRRRLKRKRLQGRTGRRFFYDPLW